MTPRKFKGRANKPGKDGTMSPRLVVALVVALALAGCSARRVLGERSPHAAFGAITIARNGAYRLSNGLTVVLIEDHWHPTAALEVCYRVGSRDDPYGQQGVSHLVEHLTFASPTSGAGVPADLQVLAERAYATTNQDTTCYGNRVPRERLARALEVEARRMEAFDPSPKAIERETTVIARERGELIAGDTWRNLLEEVDAAAFRLHPYRFPVSGWPETLGRITLAEVRRQFATFYAPDNAVLVAVGDFQTDELLASVVALFGRLSARRARPAEPPVEPVQTAERRVVLSTPRSRPRLVVAYRVPAFDAEVTPVLEVLASLLAGSDDALLAGVPSTQAAAVEYNRFSRDPDLFYVKLALARGADSDETLSGVDDVLSRLASNGPRDVEVTRAKKRALLAFYLEQTPSERANRIAKDATLEMASEREHYAEGIRSVTAADVRRAVRAYFTKSNRTVGSTGASDEAVGPG